jgi:hypothetical protein
MALVRFRWSGPTWRRAMNASAHREEHADIEKTPTEARQSIKTGHMRYVLGLSLTLALFLMVITYLAYF